MAGPTNPFLIGEMAQGLLERAHLAVKDSENGDPEKVYVTYANPVDDCKNYLLVYVGPITPHFGAFGPGRAAQQRAAGVATSVPFFVRLIRCVTTPGNSGIVPPSEQQKDALKLAEDGWRLWRSLVQDWKADNLFGTAYSVGQSNITLDPLNPVPGTGGVAGWQWKITAQVDEVTKTS